MHRFVVALMAMLCAVAGLACQARPDARSPEYAAVHAQPTDALLLKHTCVHQHQQEPDEGTPLLAIEAHFIEGLVGDLRKHGLVGDYDVQIVSPEHAQELLNWTQHAPTSSVIGTPRLVMFSGQLSSVSMYTKIPFVQDFAIKTDQGGRFLAEAITSQLATGWQLEVQATLDGDEIVFDRIAPQTTQLLGIRDCQANVASPTGEIPIAWWEPYLLSGTATPNQDVQVRAAQGEIVLLPLRYRTVHGPAANARAMASGGKVTETYRRTKPAPDQMKAVPDQQPSPLNRQWVVMVKASVAEDSTDTKPTR